MKTPTPLPHDAEAWLADHPDLSPAELEHPWRLAEGSNPLAAAPAPDPKRIAALRNALEEAIGGNTPRRGPLRLIHTSRRTTWLAAAAVVALLVALGVAWYVTPVTLTTPPHTATRYTLPDGSMVQLHGGASLQYARSFGTSARSVHLDGEAFFDVEQTGTPFVIETANATVTVRGTSFNVEAWRDEQAETVVAVVSGVVEVAARSNASAPVRLEAGQTTRVTEAQAAPTPPAPARLDEVTAWRDGSFLFFDQPFATIFKEIERRFSVTVHASDQILSRRHSFSKHRVHSAEDVLNDLCQSAGLRYRAISNGYEVFDPAHVSQ
jgi:transmembrane sensor